MLDGYASIRTDKVLGIAFQKVVLATQLNVFPAIVLGMCRQR